MKKNKKLWSWALASALAVSNLSAVAIPMTAFAAVPTPDGTVIGATSIKDEAGAGDDTINVTLGEVTESVVHVVYDYGNNADAKAAIASGSTTALEYGDIVKASAKQVNADAVSYTIGAGTLVTASGNDVVYPVTVVIDATGNQVAGSDVTLSFPWWDSTLSSGSGALSKKDYTIGFVATKGLSPTSNNLAIKLTTDTTDKKAVTSETVEVNSGGLTATYTAGLLVGSKVLTIDSTGITLAASKDTSLASGSDEYYWELVSSDTNILTATTTAAGVITVSTLKPGSSNLTVNLHYHNNPTGGSETDTIVGTTAVAFTVKAQPAGVTIINDNTKLTAGQLITLDKDKTSTTLTAEVTAANYTISQDVTWFQEKEANEKYVKLEQNGNVATITGIGNTNTPVKIYAVSNEDITFWNAYNNSTATSADAKLAAATGLGTPGVQNFTVTVTDTALELTTDPTSINMLEGADDETVDLVLNDATFNIATVPAVKAIVYSFESSDEDVATVKYTPGAASFDVVAGKAGSATITVTGTYKVTNASGSDETATVTAELPVTIIDPNAAEQAKADAIDAADKAADAAVANPTDDTIKAAENAVAVAKALGVTDSELQSITEKIAKAKEAKAEADKKAEEEAKKQAEEEAKKKAEEEAAKKASDGSQASTPAPVGTELKDANGKVTGFKVTNADPKNPEVEFTAPADKDAKSFTIPDTVKDQSGNEYKVTSIASGAFKDSKAKTITIGKNIKSIDKNAFKDSDIKTVKVKGTKLTKKMAKAFNKLKKDAKVKVSGSNKKKNKKYLNALKNVKNGKIKVK